jgi:hypothetical protein
MELRWRGCLRPSFRLGEALQLGERAYAPAGEVEWVLDLGRKNHKRKRVL